MSSNLTLPIALIIFFFFSYLKSSAIIVLPSLLIALELDFVKIISEFLGKHYFNTFELKDPILRLSILLDPKEKCLERLLSLKKNESLIS